MDQLTDRQWIIPGHSRFRDVYRGPPAIAFAASIAVASGATLLDLITPRDTVFWNMAARSNAGTLALIVVAMMRDPAKASW
jgi:hypothetical protein